MRSLRGLAEQALTILPLAAAGAVAFVIFYAMGWALGRAVRRAASRWRRQHNLAIVLARLTRWGVNLAGLLVALMIALPGFRPAQLASILGLGSVAVGFAFRDILQNFLAGLLLLSQEPFRIGDQIVAAGYEGTVEQIETRATFIRTYDNRRVVIPNAVLFTSSVIVNTAYPVRRLEHDLGIGYGDDIERAREVILAALREDPEVLAAPAPDVLCVDLADHAVRLRVRWWVRPPERRDALDSRDRVLADVKRALTAAGIDLPFPTHQVLLHDQTEEGDGDRARQREGWPVAGDAAPAAGGIARALRALGPVARAAEPDATARRAERTDRAG
ncbi:MAG: mechanosensitive ion channel family protein [Planctomycetes bacterium]|nr:mechanosensitive ion channel family protein [Planctomycetota bacterium]